MDAPANVLAYEESLDREGLVIEQSERFVRVITPRPGDWRTISKGMKLGIVAAGAMTIVYAVIAVGSPRTERWMMFLNSGVMATCGTLVCLTAWRQMHRRYVFDVSRDTFSASEAVQGAVRSLGTFRRDVVRDIHAGRIDGRMLIISVQGQDLMELLVGGDPAMVSHVAEILSAAIRADLAAVDRTVPVAIYSSAMMGDPQMTRMVTRIVVIAALTVAMLVYLKVGMVAAFFTFVVTTTPLGIILGTQRKQYWP